VSIAVGEGNSLFVKSDSSLWVMGLNSDGQLGDGTYNNTNLPEMIVPGNVTAVAGGDFHSLLLKSDGSLWAMGDNNYGQLGDGTLSNTNRPEPICANYFPLSGRLSVSTDVPYYAQGWMRLAFPGRYGSKKYALDRSSALTPANWVPQSSNYIY
jgi:alpha-tubulin suppressor-like RCC1 family protein